MSPKPALGVAERAAFLGQVTELSALTDEDITVLAELTTVARYPYRHVFSEVGETEVAPTLRVVVHGSIVVHTAQNTHSRRRWLRVGELLGAQSLVTWASAHGFINRPVPTPHEIHAVAYEPVWVLELTADRFADLFAKADAMRVADAFVEFLEVHERAPEIVEALRATADLRFASDDDLQDLAAGASVRRVSVGSSLYEQVQVPKPVHVILEGTFDAVRPSASGQLEHVTFGPGMVLGQKELLHPQLSARQDHQVVCSQPAVVADLRGEVCLRMLWERPRFYRAVRRATEIDASLDAVAAVPGLEHEADLLLFAASDSISAKLDLGRLLDGLQDAMESHLDERVCRLRLIWNDTEPTSLFDLAVDPEPKSDLPARLRALIATAIEAYEGAYDVFFIDASSLGSTERLQRILAQSILHIEAPRRIVYLFESTTDWERLPSIYGSTLAGFSVLPAVLLPPAQKPVESPRDILEKIEVRLEKRTRARHPWTRQTPHRTGQLWPLDAVRLRFSQRSLASFAPTTSAALDIDAQTQSSLQRFARACTDRRVGVALGGAGALSYACVPWMRALTEAGIPIDIVSGTSFGAMVGAYYVAHGTRGLDMIADHWHMAQLTVLFGYVTTRPLQAWLNYDLDFMDIADTEVSFVPVATHAYSGYEWEQRNGAFGQVCSASGSLPPLAPTFDGNTRLIDGALSADVPSRVLVEAGAGMVLGVNAIPPPPPRPGENIRIPFVSRFMHRATDSVRAYLMMLGHAARNQERFADVTYSADTRSGSGASFWLREEIIAEAEGSASFQGALSEAKARWQRIRMRPGGRPHRHVKGRP